MKSYCVYILASERNGTLYIGVTNNLTRRLDEHVNGLKGSFTDRYGVKQLVYVEQTESIESALYREKQIKRWNRTWKLELIESSNPEWKDLAEDL